MSITKDVVLYGYYFKMKQKSQKDSDPYGHKQLPKDLNFMIFEYSLIAMSDLRCQKDIYMNQNKHCAKFTS